MPDDQKNGWNMENQLWTPRWINWLYEESQKPLKEGGNFNGAVYEQAMTLGDEVRRDAVHVGETVEEDNEQLGDLLSNP